MTGPQIEPTVAFDAWFDPDYFTEDTEGDQRHGFLAGWDAARSAVVRPPEEVPEAVVTVRQLRARIAELEAAVVRPTREGLARLVRNARSERERFRSVAPRTLQDVDFDIADALLAEFWPGTPEPRDDEFFTIDGVRYDGRIILAEWTAYQEAAARRREAQLAFARGVAVSDSQETPTP